MINYSSLSAYFEELAAKYKPIGHTPENPRFAEMDMDELLSALKTGLDTTNPVLLFMMPEGAMGWRNDKVVDLNRAEFYILQHLGKPDPAKRKAILQSCKEIARAILVRIQYEKYQLHKGLGDHPTFVRSFDLNQVRYFRVGPIMNSCYGWRIELDFEDTAPALMKDSDWSDLDTAE
jgi:hypothetical protein